MRKIKLFTLITLLALLTLPALAQNRAQNERGINNSATTNEKSEKIRAEIKNKMEKKGQFKSQAAIEHRSAVATFVQGLLDVADRQALGGIGELVREVARLENASEDKVTPMLDKVKNKNNFRKFLFGTDFKATQAIKKEMQAATKRMAELTKAKAEIVDPGEKASLEAQIKDFQDNVNTVLSAVEAEEGKFSLFGWAKKLFILS